MIASDATSQRSSDVHAEILFRTRSDSSASELPGAGRCLSQGAVVGAFLAFLFILLCLFTEPHDFFILIFLPTYLMAGMVFGLFMGAVIWAATHVIRQQIHPIIRAFMATVVITGIFVFEFNLPLTPNKSHPPLDYLIGLQSYIAYGVLFGFLIGSRFRPVHELLRGGTAMRWPVMNAITGLPLRVVVVFGVMESVLYVVYVQGQEFNRSDFTLAVIALIHFSAAAVIVFARLPFWLLLPLALIVNVPIAIFVTDVLTKNDGPMRTITLHYLALWAAFLSCRLSVPRAALSFIKEEFHYYLGV